MKEDGRESGLRGEAVIVGMIVGLAVTPIFVYEYIYIHTHVYTHTHVGAARRGRDCGHDRGAGGNVWFHVFRAQRQTQARA